MATIHTKQLQQYTQDNYNNTHKTTNNSTHKTTTIHTRQLQQYTRSTNNNNTKNNLKQATKKHETNYMTNL